MNVNETRVIDLTVNQLQQLIEETLNAKTFSQNSTDSTEQDLVPIEIAMKITNLARQTIYGLVYVRRIPFIKRPKSRKLFFSRKALMIWIEEGGK